ncbi:acetate kinase [Candidatus Aerophobetes bacterium]|nr:acetate kinase [Candidatus Aerophobetes bacterium]
MKILVINCGSSSIKYKLLDINRKEEVLAWGNLQRIGERNSLQLHFLGDKKIKTEEKIANHKQGLNQVLHIIVDKDKGILEDLSQISAVGHRVVHGGERFLEPSLIDEEVINTIRKLVPLAPLHNPPNLAGVEAARSLLPRTPQVAVFDTAFHQSLPPKAFLYGLPYEYYKKYGIRRYGFHGTSHKYVCQKAAKAMGIPLEKLKMISCHLGNGCSITAIQGGKSVDTSMGFTPLEGLVMGTRCGDLDPALVLWLIKQEGLRPAELEDVLNTKSGLLGISGLSNDVRDLQKAEEAGHGLAKLALDIFVYRIKKYIGAYSAILSGLDGLVFTGGIGENGAEIRRHICDGLEFLGIDLDEEKNKRVDSEVISKNNSSVKILVIPTDEEIMIARETQKIIQNQGDSL